LNAKEQNLETVFKPFGNTFLNRVGFYLLMDDLKQALKRCEVTKTGSFVLASHQDSDLYVDIKKACGDPDALALMADYLHGLFPEGVTCVAGAGYGGLPLATAISLFYDLRLTKVRTTPRGHGTEQYIEGYL